MYERDLDRLPVDAELARSNAWWGMWGFITITVAIFATFIVSYFYLGTGFDPWPPAERGQPDHLLSSVGTGLLAIACVPMVLAHLGIWARSKGRVLLAVGLAIVLGLAFFVLKIVELTGYEFDWTTDSYGSIFWMTQLFFLAFFTGILVNEIVRLGLLAYDFSPQMRHMNLAAIIRYSFAALWMAVFITLYLVPLIQGP